MIPITPGAATAVGSSDSVFINRLLGAINENTINSLFTSEEIAAADLNTEEGKLELAGILVAKAMKMEAESFK